MIYTFALFDLKSMYLAKDFMRANQYGVDAGWLFVLVILFALILHYTITLQYSAFFHIYWNIAKKYEPVYVKMRMTDHINYFDQMKKQMKKDLLHKITGTLTN